MTDVKLAKMHIFYDALGLLDVRQPATLFEGKKPEKSKEKLRKLLMKPMKYENKHRNEFRGVQIIVKTC